MTLPEMVRGKAWWNPNKMPAIKGITNLRKGMACQENTVNLVHEPTF